MKKFIAYILMILYFQSAYAMQGEAFIEQYYKHYYAYGMFGVKSMEFKLSTPEIIDYIQKNSNIKEYYLLQAFASTTGELYFASLVDSVELTDNVKNALKKRLSFLKKEYKTVFPEFNLFLLNTPFWDIPQDFEFSESQDKIVFKFRLTENNRIIEVTKEFNKDNGLCLAQAYRTGNYTIKTYPYFQKITGQWFCTGWDTQIFQNGKLSSGTGVRFDLIQGDRGLWIPSVIKIMTQTPQKINEPVMQEIYIYDIKLYWANNKQ